ncbi:hypothetical protein ACFFWD_37315 [Bradyrhizobium erythrophlei]
MLHLCGIIIVKESIADIEQHIATLEGLLELSRHYKSARAEVQYVLLK